MYSDGFKPEGKIARTTRLLKNVHGKATIFVDGYEISDFSILDEHMSYVKHINGKVYEMTDEGAEYSIPYDELIKYLDEKGYE